MRTALCVLLLASTLHADELPSQKRPLLAPSIFLVSGQMLDGLTTVKGLERGCYETNPFFGKHPSTPQVWASKGLIAGGLGVGMYLAQKHGHPGVAKLLGYYGGGAGMAGTVLTTTRCR